MREAIKTKIRKEISAVHVEFGEKEKELKKQMEVEEGNPQDMEEVLEEVVHSPDKEHKVSEITKSRFDKFNDIKAKFDQYDAMINDTIAKQTIETEMEFLSDVEVHCSGQKKIIKSI